MYIESKAHGDRGEARIGRVTFSKTGATLYYGGSSFRRLRGRGIRGNYFDVRSGDEYWISGPKRDGSDRLFAERLPVPIDEDVRVEYWIDIRRQPAKVERTDAHL
jgi:hypothetical protein